MRGAVQFFTHWFRHWIEVGRNVETQDAKGPDKVVIYELRVSTRNSSSYIGFRRSSNLADVHA